MKNSSKPWGWLASLCLLASIGLIGFGIWDYWSLNDQSRSDVQHQFADLEANHQLLPYQPNRLVYQFTNRSGGRSRIIGHNFC
jgi:hypothetical protein